MFKKALKLAEVRIDISNEDNVIISLPGNYSCSTREKHGGKRDNGLFDKATGVFHGAEVCKFVGNFLLYKLCQRYEWKNLDLHLDDGSTFFRNVRGSSSEKVKKFFLKHTKTWPWNYGSMKHENP